MNLPLGYNICSRCQYRHCWPLCSRSAHEDVVVLGVHDLKLKSAQTILVEEVFNPVHDAGFPPQSDLSLLRLSVPARFGMEIQSCSSDLHPWLGSKRIPWFCLQAQTCLRYASLRKMRSSMTAGHASQQGGEKLKQQVTSSFSTKTLWFWSFSAP